MKKNMWKIYWKQTIQLIKQNTLISTISIIGTALAIMMIMVLLLVEHISVVEMAPEVNRSKLLYLSHYEMSDTILNERTTSNISRTLFDNYIKKMEKPNLISIIDKRKLINKTLVTKDDENEVFSARQMSTDANYWKIMSFDFIAGTPFTQADCDAQLNKVIIAESKAIEIFGNSKAALYKMINLDFEPFQITGVIKDVSTIFTFCNASIFTSDIQASNRLTVLLLANTTNDFSLIEEEIKNAERQYTIDHPNKTFSFWGPYNQKYQKYNVSNFPVDEKEVDLKNFFLLLILLVIPAVNLSSFSFSQIRKRIEEIGIRKSFGATKSSIIKQILIENFITTLIGGIIGLVVSYAIIIWLRTWLLEIPDGGSIPPQLLLSPLVFVMVFIICFILNILSAGIPALVTINMKIVDSLSNK